MSALQWLLRRCEGREMGCDVSGPAQVRRMRAGRDEVGLREEMGVLMAPAQRQREIAWYGGVCARAWRESEG